MDDGIFVSTVFRSRNFDPADLGPDSVRKWAATVRPRRTDFVGIRRIPYRQSEIIRSTGNFSLGNTASLCHLWRMTIGEKLRSIRRECGLSQEAIGAQGYVSTPGWIKLENGQRSPSEELIEKLTSWLVKDKHLRNTTAKELREELLTLKYLGSSSHFLRGLAQKHAATLANGPELLTTRPVPKPPRGRPRLTAR